MSEPKNYMLTEKQLVILFRETVDLFIGYKEEYGKETYEAKNLTVNEMVTRVKTGDLPE